MEVGKLTVQHRKQTGKGVARKLRAQGEIPGVCYGHDVAEAVPIAVNTRALKASLDPVKRQNTVVNMTIEGDGAPRTMVVMVKDYQIDTLRRELTHVDLVAIDTAKEVVSKVPLEFTGKPKALISGGQLHVVRHDMEVRCRPADIPAKIFVDVTELDIGGVIHVSDLSMPPGVSAHTAERLTIVTCTAPEAVDTPAEPAAADAPAKGKGGKKDGGK